MYTREPETIKKDMKKVEEIIKPLKEYSKEHPKDYNIQLQVKSFEIRLNQIQRELLISKALKNLEHETFNHDNHIEVLEEMINKIQYSKPYTPKSPIVKEFIKKFETENIF